MNLLPNRTVPPGDDLDGLLRGFFRQEMPVPWPAAPSPVADAPGSPVLPLRRPTPRGQLFRSRLALVASVALLVLGSLLVRGKVDPAASLGGDRLILPDNGSGKRLLLPPKGAIKTSLSLEQDPMGETRIIVDVTPLEDGPPAR